MGRRVIEIERIEKPAKRMATFKKRRKGLLKKAMELSILTGCKITLTMSIESSTLVYASSKEVFHQVINDSAVDSPTEEDLIVDEMFTDLFPKTGIPCKRMLPPVVSSSSSSKAIGASRRSRRSRRLSGSNVNSLGDHYGDMENPADGESSDGVVGSGEGYTKSPPSHSLADDVSSIIEEEEDELDDGGMADDDEYDHKSHDHAGESSMAVPKGSRERDVKKRRKRRKIQSLQLRHIPKPRHESHSALPPPFASSSSTSTATSAQDSHRRGGGDGVAPSSSASPPNNNSKSASGDGSSSGGGGVEGESTARERLSKYGTPGGSVFALMGAPSPTGFFYTPSTDGIGVGAVLGGASGSASPSFPSPAPLPSPFWIHHGGSGVGGVPSASAAAADSPPWNTRGAQIVHPGGGGATPSGTSRVGVSLVGGDIVHHRGSSGGDGGGSDAPHQHHGSGYINHGGGGGDDDGSGAKASVVSHPVGVGGAAGTLPEWPFASPITLTPTGLFHTSTSGTGNSPGSIPPFPFFVTTTPSVPDGRMPHPMLFIDGR